MEAVKTKARPVKKITKKFKVEDQKGNRHILKATVISVNPHDVKKAQSSQLMDEDLESVGLEGKVLEPPLSLFELAVLPEFSTELPQITKALSTGVSGFGWKLDLHTDISTEKKDALSEQIQQEKEKVLSLLEHPNRKMSLVALAKQMHSEKAIVGNAYWELVPNPKEPQQYSCINRINPATVRITKADRMFTRVSENFIRSDFTIGRKFFMERLRRFVQIKGRRKVYFKEFGDPRIIDKRTGEVADESLAFKFRANELYHWVNQSMRDTPYGLHLLAVSDHYANNHKRFISETIQNAVVEQGMPKKQAGTFLKESLAKRLGGFEQSVPPAIKAKGQRAAAAYFEGLSATTVTRARNFSQINLMDEVGITRVAWAAIIDNRTSQICQDMNGRVFTIQQVKTQKNAILEQESGQALKENFGWRKDLNEFGLRPGERLDSSEAAEALTRSGVPIIPPAHFRCRSELVPA